MNTCMRCARFVCACMQGWVSATSCRTRAARVNDQQEHHFCEPNNNLSRRHPSSDPSLISSHALAHQENNGTYILIKGWKECFNTPTLTGSCQ